MTNAAPFAGTIHISPVIPKKHPQSALLRLPQNIDCRRGNASEVVGTDVEQVIDASAVQVLADAAYLIGVLPVVVKGLVAPGVVEGRRGFIEHIALVVIGDFVVTGGGVVAASVADAGVDQTVRLVLLDHIVKLVRLLGRDGARCVKPDQAQIAVPGENLFYLRLDLRLKALRVVLVFIIRIVQLLTQ